MLQGPGILRKSLGCFQRNHYAAGHLMPQQCAAHLDIKLTQCSLGSLVF